MKHKIYFSIVLLAALSCSREIMIEEDIQVPEAERMVFSADIESALKSHLAEDGTTLEWDKEDRVSVSSAYSEDGSGNPVVGAEKWSGSISEVMPIKIDGENPAKATLLSGKRRSAWVGDGEGKYSFYAVYPASATNTEESPVIEDNVLWAPVQVPSSQDGKNLGKYQICADFTGTPYEKGAILNNTTKIQFNNFQPKTALLNFNATSAAGDIPISQIEIFASWANYGSHSSYPQLTGDAFISEAGVIRPGGGGSYVTIRLDSPVTIGATASKQILAAIIPTESDAVVLDFMCYDAEHNPRLTGKITSPDGFLGGKKYTFTVAMTEAETSVLAVDCVRNFPPEGGTYTGRVVSYTYVEGTKTAVDWDLAAFQDENCTIPVDDISAFENWAHFTSSFTPSETEVGVTTYEYAINANTNIELISRPDDVTAEIRAALQGATYRGDKANNSPWNLATTDGTLNPATFNSANCYIINQPGYYLLPCVAGNGIKNGEYNRSAYETVSTYGTGEGDYDPLFVDYLGAPIADPRIGHTSSGSGTPYAAYLLWEDAEGLISTSSYYAPEFSSDLPEETKNYLETISPYALPVVYDSNTGIWGIIFEIEPQNIDQGNAVIAVMDEQARIMWSWHIWATDYNPYQSVIPVKSYWSDGDYNYMRRNLGWVAVGKSTEIKYKDNSMYIKVWQVRTNPETGEKEAIPESEGGRSIVVPLLQEGTHLFDADIQYGYGPYYQAGRKDPLTPGMRGADGYMHDVPTYGAIKALTGLDFVTENNMTTRLSDGIQYPYKYFYKSGPLLEGGAGWFTDAIDYRNGFLWNNTVINGELSIASVIVRKDPTVKTVYDPNPAGFAMPPMDAGGTFFAFFTGGKYENYISEMGGADGALLRAKYVSLLVSASEYGCLFYASLADKARDDAGSGPVNMGFMPQVGRRYYQLNGQFQTSAFVNVDGSGSNTTYVNEMANSPNCGGYYSNYVLPELSPVLLCAYPYMFYGFLTASSSALPIRSVVEEVKSQNQP